MNREFNEEIVTFDCDGDRIVAIHTQPQSPHDIGVLIVVGGPQYRVGSHRQFTLLARSLGDVGIPALRFDTRGMGDSDGEFPGFDGISADIEAAIDEFQRLQPGLDRVVIWGLCDAASAAMIYGDRDSRVAGMILLNPWVRSEAGQAKTLLKHYYIGHLLSAGFWKRLFSGDVGLMPAIGNLLGNLGRAFGRDSRQVVYNREVKSSFVERMRSGLRAFSGPTLFIISGNDLTAAEFTDLVEASRAWRELVFLDSTETVRLDDADHTFSDREARETVERLTADWVKALERA